ncbi:uncharacterized protein NPIL_635991 [Nephila pilipes]|uniref:Uncharacterized protein n=1 Tax=Nephila pilipes TaxID=299642 RepID=A0A8X6P717_NEPPI|nr:uncharacterized protein NPIL_635991 [Nephila pilipes]
MHFRSTRIPANPQAVIRNISNSGVGAPLSRLRIAGGYSSATAITSGLYQSDIRMDRLIIRSLKHVGCNYCMRRRTLSGRAIYPLIHGRSRPVNVGLGCGRLGIAAYSSRCESFYLIRRAIPLFWMWEFIKDSALWKDNGQERDQGAQGFSPGAGIPRDRPIRNQGGRNEDSGDTARAITSHLKSFAKARQGKIDKYLPIVEHLRREGKVAHVDAIVVGSLGSWDPSNDAALAQMGVSRKYAKLMRKLICSDTIRWSRDIYIQHLTDKKQY